jgi:hypothetical protein
MYIYVYMYIYIYINIYRCIYMYLAARGPVEEDGDLGQREAGHGAPIDPHQDVVNLPVAP